MTWQTKKLGDVCEVIAGQSPEGSFYNRTGKGLPFYQGKKEFTEKYLGKPTAWTTKTTKEAKGGDILISVRAPVGPVNFATNRICIGRGLASIRAGEHIDKDFLFNFLQMFESKIVGNAGAVFSSISKNQIENIEIPLPPVAEQKRVVEKLNNVFEKVAGAKENAEKNLQNSKGLFESYLRQVFTNTGKGWEIKSLKELAEYSIGLTYSPKDVSDKGIIVLRSSNVQNDKLDFSDIVRVNKKVKEQLKVRSGDILMCSRNGSKRLVGKTARIEGVTEEMTFGTFMMVIRGENNDYLYWFFKSGEFRRQIAGGENTMINQITRYMLNDVIVSVPPKSEWKSIVKKLEALSIETKKLEKIYEQKLADLDELKKSVLQKAFAGEL